MIPGRFFSGILNSRLINYLFLRKYIDINIKGVYLAEVPLRRLNVSDTVDKAQHDKMVKLVDQMLSSNKRLPEAKTDQEKTSLHRQIDAVDQQI